MARFCSVTDSFYHARAIGGGGGGFGCDAAASMQGNESRGVWDGKNIGVLRL